MSDTRALSLSWILPVHNNEGIVAPNVEMLVSRLRGESGHDLFLVEKAVYEIAYELDNRPAWLSIPVEGLLALLEVEGVHGEE